MSIHWEKTSELNGMKLEDCKIYFNKYPKSKKKVVKICDDCDGEQIVEKRNSDKLCRRCAKLGKNNPMFGKHFSEEHKEKIRNSGMGRKHTIESKEKMSKSQKGKKKTPEHKKKLSEANTGKKLTPEHKNNISKGNTGDKHWNWQGGVSYDPYCEKFNPTKKKEVREKYNNCDYLTGIHKDICNVMKNGKVWELAVHHVDFNKQQGCNDIPWKLVPVSQRHNTMFNQNEPFWEKLILYALEYDKEYYKDQEGDFYVN